MNHTLQYAALQVATVMGVVVAALRCSAEQLEVVPSPPRAASAALQVATATVVIAADLGRPAEVLPTVLFWLDQVQRKLAATYASLERRGSKLPEQLRLRARRYFGSQHEDADLVQHTGEGPLLW